VQWDRGLGSTFYELVGGAEAYMSLEFVLNEATIFESLTPGHSYQFRYRALNKYGWGPFSDVASFKAAAIPLQADPVTTTIENLYVKIAWEKPNDMSSPIEEYEIAIKQADGVFNSTNGQFCQGNDQAVVNNRYCHIPLQSVLRLPPYNLVYGDLVVAKVKARNSIGWSV